MLLVITPKIVSTRSSRWPAFSQRLDRVLEGRRVGIVGDRLDLAPLLVDRELERLAGTAPGLTLSQGGTPP